MDGLTRVSIYLLDRELIIKCRELTTKSVADMAVYAQLLSASAGSDDLILDIFLIIIYSLNLSTFIQIASPYALDLAASVLTIWVDAIQLI